MKSKRGRAVKMKVKDFLLSPWLPVWTAILMMANVVAVDMLHLAWPITVAGPDLRCPAGPGVAVLLSVAAVAVVMLVVELRKRRWLRVGVRLLLVLAGFGILMAGSGLWLAYCHDLNHTMMIEVERVNENLLDVDGWKMDEEQFVGFLRKLERCSRVFHMRVDGPLHGYDIEGGGVCVSVLSESEESVEKLCENVLFRCTGCGVNRFRIVDDKGWIPFVLPAPICYAWMRDCQGNAQKYIRAELGPNGVDQQCRIGKFDDLIGVDDEHLGGEVLDYEKVMSKEVVQEVHGIINLCVVSKCTVGQFRQALREFYDRGYKTIWVLFY